MNTYTLLVFAATWVLMARDRVPFLPVGRAAGTLLGAVLMVAGGALSPADAFAAIDAGTIGLLFGMMVLTAELAEAGVIEAAADRLVRRFRGPAPLLWGIGLGSGIGSALLVNDTICLFATPVVVAACRRCRIDPVPHLVALAAAANVGSIATLVGNPQLMIIGRLSGISFADWAATMAPLAATALVVAVAIVHLWFRRRLATGPFDAVREDIPVIDVGRARRALVVVAGTFVAFLAGVDLAWAALGGASAMLVVRRAPAAPLFARVDFGLLVFFASLFVVVRAVGATGLPARLFGAVDGGPWEVPAIVGLSNLVSNVPLVLLAAPHTSGDAAWFLLGMASTTAGNLTLPGSAANLIVAENSGLRFRDHLVPGILVTVATTALGWWWLS